MRLMLLAAVMAVSGCSTFSQDQVNNLNALISQGRCAEAEQIAAGINSAVRFNNLGVVAHNCERNPSKAKGYYEHGARLGEPNAINNLLRNGWAVPRADLREAQEARESAALRDFANTMSAARAQPVNNFSAPGMLKFLKNSYMQQGSQMCAYDDGSVINMGIGICPLSMK